MQVSFVIPLYNCLPLTQAMVASLQASLPPGLAHEIILVDDGSTDGTREWLATLRPPFQVILHERNLGYAAATNRGAALACGEYLALLNNDLLLAPGWLEPMLAAHRHLGPRAGLVGNIQRQVRTGTVDHCGLQLSLRGKLEHRRTGPGPLARWLAPVRPPGRNSADLTRATSTAARTWTSACAPWTRGASMPWPCAASCSTT